MCSHGRVMNISLSLGCCSLYMVCQFGSYWFDANISIIPGKYRYVYREITEESISTDNVVSEHMAQVMAGLFDLKTRLCKQNRPAWFSMCILDIYQYQTFINLVQCKMTMTMTTNMVLLANTNLKLGYKIHLLVWAWGLHVQTNRCLPHLFSQCRNRFSLIYRSNFRIFLWNLQDILPTYISPSIPIFKEIRLVELKILIS